MSTSGRTSTSGEMSASEIAMYSKEVLASGSTTSSGEVLTY